MVRRRWLLVGALSAFAVLSLASVSAALSATIKSVTFSGSQAHPVITIRGTAFGSRPAPNPDYAPPSPSHPLCPVQPVGSLASYGLDYGTRLWIQSSNWSAGRYRPGIRELDCIGLLIKTYSATKIVYTLGHAYPHIPTATPVYDLAPGASFEAGVAGTTFSGTVHYS